MSHYLHSHFVSSSTKHWFLFFLFFHLPLFFYFPSFRILVKTLNDKQKFLSIVCTFWATVALQNGSSVEVVSLPMEIYMKRVQKYSPLAMSMHLQSWMLAALSKSPNLYETCNLPGVICGSGCTANRLLKACHITSSPSKQRSDASFWIMFEMPHYYALLFSPLSDQE